MVPNIDQKERIQGLAEISVQYGVNKEKLRYVLEHEGSLNISIIQGDEPRKIHAKAVMRHKNITHSVRAID